MRTRLTDESTGRLAGRQTNIMRNEKRQTEKRNNAKKKQICALIKVNVAKGEKKVDRK